jgi:carbon monoxide dehydrogenase subunit G
MPQITKSVEIKAAPEATWRIIADFGAVANWAPAVREAHCTSDSTSGLGCKRSLTSSTGHIIEEVIIRWDQGRSLTFEIPGGLAKVLGSLQETWSVEATPNGSQAFVVMEYQSKFGFVGAAMARLIVQPVLAKMLTENLAGLKYHLETGEFVTKDTTVPLLAVVD